MRVDFEFTALEAAEMHLQWHTTSRVARWVRWREQVFFVVALVLMVAVISLASSRRRQPETIVIHVAIAVVVALALTVPFRWFYDELIRKRTHRFLREHLGGEGPHLCSVELRPEHVWSRQNGVEYLFPWTEATAVSDNPDGILIVFRGGRVLARNRGVASPEQRREFLEIARASATMRAK